MEGRPTFNERCINERTSRQEYTGKGLQIVRVPQRPSHRRTRNKAVRSELQLAAYVARVQGRKQRREFWRNAPGIEWVVMRQQHIEEVVETTCSGDDTDVANANALPLVLNGKITVRFWDPQWKAALLEGEVPTINV